MALHAPQMVLNSRMLYFTWVPADPDAVAKLMPAGLSPVENRQVFMNQYVVDSERQTSGFAPYSLTYLGPDLAGHDTPDGAVSGRWWTHYFNSSAEMRSYASERGVPATPGTTTLEHDGTGSSPRPPSRASRSSAPRSMSARRAVRSPAASCAT